VFFSQEFIEKLSTRFVHNLRAGLDPKERKSVNVSSIELANAFKDAQTDISFIETRRGLKDGISEGKLGGVLLFRLCRRRIVHLLPPLCEDDSFIGLQEQAALVTVMEQINLDLRLDAITRKIGHPRPAPAITNFQDIETELIFLIRTRHYNQETLGLLLDAACYIDLAARNSAKDH
jgi:hypothetical protein